MVTRFLDAGDRAAWVAGDEVYDGNPRLRTALEERGTGYVLAVACSHEVTTGAGRFRPDMLARKVPKRAWQKLSAGAGAKGHRFYDWAVIDLTDPRPGSRQLLIRRNRSTGERAYYRCYSPAAVPLTTLVCVAGSRWRVEEFFQSGKGLAALNEHQVRRYPSWSRWVTLAMLAHAFLAVLRANEHEGHPSPDELIPLTCDEIQRLFITLVNRTVFDPVHRLRWSVWRRRHQARSQTSHYRRQAAQA
ncbi:SRSO17 transposase [Streptomyces sp. V4I8]